MGVTTSSYSIILTITRSQIIFRDRQTNRTFLLYIDHDIIKWECARTPIIFKISIIKTLSKHPRWLVFFPQRCFSQGLFRLKYVIISLTMIRSDIKIRSFPFFFDDLLIYQSIVYSVAAAMFCNIDVCGIIGESLSAINIQFLI